MTVVKIRHSKDPAIMSRRLEELGRIIDALRIELGQVRDATQILGEQVSKHTRRILDLEDK